MKIIFLNTWWAEMRKNIEDFMHEHAASTDIFCLQEVGPSLRPFFEDLFPEHRLFYATRKQEAGEPGDTDFYNATYIKKGIDIISVEPLLTDIKGAGLAVLSRVRIGQNIFNICNVHGQSRPGDKLDTPQRIAQSKAIIEFLDSLEGEKIVGGDFNLMPETESVRMFEDAGYRNLIKDFSIKTTRNQLCWDKHAGNKQNFADYVFTSAGVNIKSFKVVENEVSDHLPMVLNTILAAVSSGR